MGVELQHCGVYGYRFEGRFRWDEMYSDDDISHDRVDRLMNYSSTHDAGTGDFVLLQDPRGREYCIAGIVCFITGSTRRREQLIEPTVMDEPDPALVEAMERTIDEGFHEVERKTDEPEHIVLTHNW